MRCSQALDCALRRHLSNITCCTSFMTVYMQILNNYMVQAAALRYSTNAVTICAEPRTAAFFARFGSPPVRHAMHATSGRGPCKAEPPLPNQGGCAPISCTFPGTTAPSKTSGLTASTEYVRACSPPPSIGLMMDKLVLQGRETRVSQERVSPVKSSE